MTLKKLLVGLSPLAGLGVVLWIGLRADVSLSTVVGVVTPRTHLMVVGAFLSSLLGRGARISLLARPLVFLSAGSLLPPPGGGGAIELGFVATLEPIFGGATLTGLLFWWRWYTFYLGGILGGLFLYFSLGKTKGPAKDGQV